MTSSSHVTIVEVGPRDGLQNEQRLVPVQDKIRLVDLLLGCGLEKIEVTSFVDPERVPQMADAAGVLRGVTRRAGVSYAALVPNLRGYQAAKAARADEVAVFASASEGFSRRNINCSISESLERFRPVFSAAAADGMPVRGYVSCVTDCPYDGPVSPVAVAQVASRLIEMGCYEVSLGDTVGAGIVETISSMLDAVLNLVPAERLAGHYHDTGGMALSNIGVSLEKGLRTFDAAVAGLGGCPFAPGAQGNVATHAVVEMLDDLGYETGIDCEKLRRANDFAVGLRTDAS